MSDSFADLWNTAAPIKPSAPPQKLGSLSSQPSSSYPRRPQNDLFSQLSSAGSTASSATNSRPMTPATSGNNQPSKTAASAGGSSDAFSGLFGAGSTLGASRSAANMTMAERAALAEKQRVNSLMQQHAAQQKQASTPSAWDGLDRLGSKTFATSNATVPQDDWGLGSAVSNKPTSTPNKVEDDWGLSDFASAAPTTTATASKPTPSVARTSSGALWDLDEFSSPNSRTDSPGHDFDFGKREDVMADTDDILGDLSRPIESIQKEREQKARVSATPSPQPNSIRSHSSQSGRRTAVSSPPPHILGQLVEMGFSITQAQTALASTDTGQDVQAALEILISNGAASGDHASANADPSRDGDGWDSDEETRGITGGRSKRFQSPSEVPQAQPRPRRDREIMQRRSNAPSPSSSSQPGQQTSLQAEKILAQASEIGFSLFNRANAAWKEGKEKVQKAYEERVAATSDDRPEARRSSGKTTPANGRPKWMQQDSEVFDDTEGAGTLRRPKAKASEGFSDTPDRPSTQNQRAPPKEVDLFSDAPDPASSPAVPSASTATGAYVSRFRHGRPKTSTSTAPAPKPLSSEVSPPAPHPTTLVSASAASLSTSQQSKLSGTNFFKLGDFPAAETAYTRAIEALPAGHASLIPLYNNRALVRLKVGDVSGVVGDTQFAEEMIGGVSGLREELRRGKGGKIPVQGSDEEEVVNLADALVKAWKRRAEAMEGREKWEEAGRDWEKVAGAEWASSAVRGEGARGAGRCRKMQQQGLEPTVRPKPKPPTTAKRPPPRRGPTPPSQALNTLRASTQAAESEDNERHVLKDTVENKLQAWKGGKETNIRALLASLDTILWPELGVQKLSMAELINENQVKIKYMKSIAKVHPDKLNAGNSTLEQRMIAGGVFGALNEAWNAFKQ